MNVLDQLFVPQIQQLCPKSITRDDNRCFVTFDGPVCEGEFIAVKADEGCLITRYRIHLLRDLKLTETHLRSLCIMSHTPHCSYGVPDNEQDEGDAQTIKVFMQPYAGRTRQFKAGDLCEATRITYLPVYFDSIDLSFLGGFDDIALMVPRLDEELASLHLRGILEDLDLGAAQRPSGMYYYRSRALQALCHVMDMVCELDRLKTVSVGDDDLRLVRQVMEIVESSLDDLPSIHELSGKLYVGHTHLCETFKAATGMTIGAYARKRRMETAQVLLRDPSLPIKEIARRMGFRTAGGFSSTFRQYVGMTPRQYRQTSRL